MKSTAVFLVSAIAAGAGAGFLFSLALPKVVPGEDRVSLFRTSGLSVRSIVAAVQETAAVRAIELKIANVTESIVPQRKPGTAVMLLSEPVAVLTPTSIEWERLEAGRQVTLIANEGRFIRVKYDQKEVSIPRTSVTQGIVSMR